MTPGILKTRFHETYYRIQFYSRKKKDLLHLSFSNSWNSPAEDACENFSFLKNSLAQIIGHFRVLLCLCFKTSLSANLSFENEFCVQFHFHASQSHFHENVFARRLALKQRHKRTRKWHFPNWTQNRLPWVPEVFLARFPVPALVMKLCFEDRRVNCWRPVITVQWSTRNYLLHLATRCFSIVESNTDI